MPEIGNPSQTTSPPPIEVGDQLPPAKINLYGEIVNLREFFQHRTGVIFGLSGAFAPNCTAIHAPAIRDAADEIRRHVDFVGCLLVNDPFVAKAWAKKLEIGDQFTFIADTYGEFTKALGLGQNLKNYGFGYRCRRFAMIVGPMAKVQWLGFRADASPEKVLQELPRKIRAPWKLLTIGIENYESFPALSGISQSLTDVTNFMTSDQNGFSEELDWQLCLSDHLFHETAFNPTKENVLNGMQWLVEGAQPGDSLFLYLGGRTLTLRDDRTFFLPVDAESEDTGIGPDEFYSVFTKLAIGCRITIIFDSYASGPSFALPYCCSGNFEEFKESDSACPPSLEELEIVMFSATSISTSLPGQPGSLAGAFVSSLTEYPVISYSQLLRKMQMQLENQFTIRMYATQKFSLNQEFSVAEPIVSSK